MNFKQFYLGCLAHASYYVGSGAEAAIIDPQRDVEQYLAEAAVNNQKIKYIIETHSHADFVSGHLELAEKTGAEIVFGRRANTQFPTHKVKDGERGGRPFENVYRRHAFYRRRRATGFNRLERLYGRRNGGAAV